MEKIKDKMLGMSLKKSLIAVFIVFVCGTGILAAITILISAHIQKTVLDSRTLSFEVSREPVLEEEYSYRIDDNYKWSPLTHTQKILYYGSSALSVLLIISYILVGGLLAGTFYYRVKLKIPLELLNNGINNITAESLDFNINYMCDDEMGQLCGAVEKMVQESISDKRKNWALLNDRSAINASISHDLGTPITVIKGYLEYLKKNVPQNRVTEEILLETLDNMYKATGRLEKYIDCVRDIQKIDAIELHFQKENMLELYDEVKNDFENVAQKQGKKLDMIYARTEKEVCIDRNQVFRILENIIVNAFRFAENIVTVEFKITDSYLNIAVTDDGKGFSDVDRENATKLFYTTKREEKNVGLGLYVSKILCEKHGGQLRIGNGENGGGKVIVQIKTEEID